MEKKDKVFTIGKKRELKITLKSDKFTVEDAVEPQHNGEYFYTTILEVNLHEGGFDLFASIVSWLISIFTDHVGDAYQKQAPYLEIKSKKENLKIWLDKSDLVDAHEIVRSIHLKVSS